MNLCHRDPVNGRPGASYLKIDPSQILWFLALDLKLLAKNIVRGRISSLYILSTSPRPHPSLLLLLDSVHKPPLQNDCAIYYQTEIPFPAQRVGRRRRRLLRRAGETSPGLSLAG
jgi:hypothetical protein